MEEILLNVNPRTIEIKEIIGGAFIRTLRVFSWSSLFSGIVSDGAS